MATINVDDVYVLDNTGKQVDDSVDYAYANSNDNLLDNAYFVGGGSQLGDGIFPINQRRQTSYTSAGRILDRWRLATANGSITLEADGVHLRSNSGTVVVFDQVVHDNIRGKTVTCSAIVNDTLMEKTYTVPSSGSFDLPALIVNNLNMNLYCGDGTTITFRIYTPSTTDRVISAAKLEYGPYSTLLNDGPPDWERELDKCLWRLERIKTSALMSAIGFGFADSTNRMFALVKCHPKAKDVTVTPTGSLYCGQASLSAIPVTYNTIYTQIPNSGLLTLTINSTNNQFVSGQMYRFGLGTNSYIDISCE